MTGTGAYGGPERRANPRHPIALTARLLLAGGSWDARTVDISSAGILIEGGPFPPGQMIDIELDLPGGARARLHGQVVRRAPQPDGGERLAAVVARGAFDSAGPVLDELLAQLAA